VGYRSRSFCEEKEASNCCLVPRRQKIRRKIHPATEKNKSRLKPNGNRFDKIYYLINISSIELICGIKREQNNKPKEKH
jgi:hypothetical protein